MKDKILDALKSVNRPLNMDELYSLLDINTIEDATLFNASLQELEENFEIYHSNKNKYMLFELCNLIKGTLEEKHSNFSKEISFSERVSSEEVF